ncbi:MAG: glycosyltransferase family 1 protein [Oligoflexia bacterium]|nr:glycosyltransferase family 1 protein [Oligoflexia bacterium]
MDKFLLEIKRFLQIKSIFIFYGLTKIILLLVLKKKEKKNEKIQLCIEAGEKGWESIEFKEYYQSACEYIGSGHVIKLILMQNQNYLKEISSTIKYKGVTHYFYDPRTGSQEFWRAILESLKIAILFKRENVLPICLSTDLAVRRWRIQSSIVTCVSGTVVCFMSSKEMEEIFPHKRLCGPNVMPLSKQTYKNLNKIKIVEKNRIKEEVVFAGSLYEPRTQTLKYLEQGLKKKNINFQIYGRNIGSKRVSDEDYWKRLINTEIVFTTSDQMMQKGTDYSHVRHMVYRYLEVLASGSLLIAQDIPGVRRFFTPGVHFIAYKNNDDAINLISYYLKNKEEAIKVKQVGHEKALSIIDARVFWLMVDAALGTRSLS